MRERQLIQRLALGKVSAALQAQCSPPQSRDVAIVKDNRVLAAILDLGDCRLDVVLLVAVTRLHRSTNPQSTCRESQFLFVREKLFLFLKVYFFSLPLIWSSATVAVPRPCLNVIRHLTDLTTLRIFASQKAPLYLALTSVPTERYGGSSPCNNCYIYLFFFFISWWKNRWFNNKVSI